MMEPFNPELPMRIAEDVWWVGSHRDGCSFQCHSYLIAHGDQSVLIDPGSPYSFPETLAKVERVMPFDDVRSFVCHHPDPDVTGALPLLGARVRRQDARILGHWRGILLLDGYDIGLPMLCVERDLDWCLDLGGRALRFVFTPYAHFPGAFCTFDTASGVMFSSDLFGGYSVNGSLFARDEGYFENLRPFHEHYIPSREVLIHAVTNIQTQPVQIIAPQHGAVIRQPLADILMEKVKTLECGLFLLSGDTHVERLSRLNRVLREATDSLILYRDFRDIVQALLGAFRRLLPVRELHFYARAEAGQVLYLGPLNRYHGALVAPPDVVGSCLDSDDCDECRVPRCTIVSWQPDEGPPLSGLRLTLGEMDKGAPHGLALIVLDQPIPVDDHLDILLTRIRQPLHVALERESIFRLLDLQRQSFYEQSIRDPLTGLFTRHYMASTVQRLADLHDQDPNAPLALAMIDIDNFKTVNDDYGHSQGDAVLRAVADIIQKAVRNADVPVRFGGEEFAVFTAGPSARAIGAIAERIRAAVAAMVLDGPLRQRRITVSVGIAVRAQREALTTLFERADAALYRAKHAGRDTVREG